MAGKKGRVDIDTAQFWKIKNRLGNDLAVRHDHKKIGLQVFQDLADVLICFKRSRLEDGNHGVLRENLDGRWAHVSAPPRWFIWLCDNSNDLDLWIANKLR